MIYNLDTCVPYRQSNKREDLGITDQSPLVFLKTDRRIYAAVIFSGVPVTKIRITQVHMANMRIPVIIIAKDTFMIGLPSKRISCMIVLIITPFRVFVKSLS